MATARKRTFWTGLVLFVAVWVLLVPWGGTYDLTMNRAHEGYFEYPVSKSVKADVVWFSEYQEIEHKPRPYPLFTPFWETPASDRETEQMIRYEVTLSDLGADGVWRQRTDARSGELRQVPKLNWWAPGEVEGLLRRTLGAPPRADDEHIAPADHKAGGKQ